jgi:hypothetical protein
MHQFGVVMEAVLASVLASYVFYLLVVHYKNGVDRRAVYPHILKWSERVVEICRVQLKDMEKASGIRLKLGAVSIDHIEAAFKNLPPNECAPMADLSNFASKATWIQYLGVQMDRSQEVISNVRLQLAFLCAEHVAILNRIDDSDHFKVLRTIRKVTISNKDIIFLATSFLKYCDACYELEKYISEHPLFDEANNGFNTDADKAGAG